MSTTRTSWRRRRTSTRARARCARRAEAVAAATDSWPVSYSTSSASVTGSLTTLGPATTATWARAASKGRAASIGRRASGVSGAGASTASFRRKASTCRARRASTWDCHAGGTSTMLHSTISTISTIDCTLQQHRYAPAGERNTAPESTGG